jgi:hypothetical protein
VSKLTNRGTTNLPQSNLPTTFLYRPTPQLWRQPPTGGIQLTSSWTEREVLVWTVSLDAGLNRQSSSDGVEEEDVEWEGVECPWVA